MNRGTQNFAIALLVMLAGGLALPAEAGKDRTGGHGSGNGGYFCREQGQAPVPCDLFFERRDFKLPYAEGQRVRYEDFAPEVRRELEELSALVERRSGGQVKLLELIRDEKIHVYDTQTFLGDDTQYLGPAISAQQAGYAYWFNKVSAEDTAELETIRVVEVDMAFLKTVPQRYQAFAILHEYLHFVQNLDHAVISPFVKALDTLLKLRDEQARGIRRLLTDDEMQDSRDFQGYLRHLDPEVTLLRSRGKDGRVIPQGEIHRYGGGVVFYEREPVSLNEGNFVGAGSVVRNLKPGEAYYQKNQVISDSVTEVPLREREWRWAEEGSLFAGFDRTTGGVTDSSGGPLNAGVLGGKLETLRKCVTYDAKGVCREHVTWLPFELELRQGSEATVQRVSAAVYKYTSAEGLFEGDVCGISFGEFSYERLRGDAGSEAGIHLVKCDCKHASNILESGDLRLLGEYGYKGGPLLAAGLGTFESRYWPERPRSFGIHVGGNAGVGLEIAQRGSVVAYANFATAGAFPATLMRGAIGARLRLDIDKNYHVLGFYERGVYRISDSGNDPCCEVDYQSFGIGLGGKWDFRGPYKRP